MHIIGLNEDSEHSITLGIIVKDYFCKIAEESFIDLGFQLDKEYENKKIYKLLKFNPKILNEFSEHSGLDFTSFSYFNCKNNDLKDFIDNLD